MCRKRHYDKRSQTAGVTETVKSDELEVRARCEGTKKWKRARRIDNEWRVRERTRNPGSYTRSPREKWDRFAIAAVCNHQIEKIFIVKRARVLYPDGKKKK